MDPIFIIGTERSGTNLLRLILNSHSSIAVPHPPHIVKLFGPLVRLYGDLREDRRFRSLVNDVCRMVELHPYPWEVRPDRERIFREARDRSLLSIYFAVYDQYREHSGKKRWACKSTFMIDHVADIAACHPGARFIFLVRDGRDVAVSAKSSIFNHYHVYYSALRWKREQAAGLSWLATLPAGRIRLLKYEDLITDCRAAVEGLCSFLGERFEEGMLEYHRSAEAKKSAGLSISWENTSRPVISGNRAKFRTHLSEKEILLFEAIAFRELEQLGYALCRPAAELEALHARMMEPRLRYWLEEKRLQLKAELLHLIRDRNRSSRLLKTAFLHYLRLHRRIAF